MTAIVIGYGSIGARHVRLLREFGLHVGVVSRREIDETPCYRTVHAALSALRPDYVIIANQTRDHLITLEELAAHEYSGTLLVEKPLFIEYVHLSRLPFRQVFVAYNLRFHPVLQRIRELLDGEDVLSVHAYAGQYLPQWRPGRDYRDVYSAQKAEGGGVLRDLSHELDYLNWLFGGWQRIAALGGHLSDLEIDSDDVYIVSMAMKRCPAVCVQLNYLDRAGRRFMLVNTQRFTLQADLIDGSVQVNDETEQHLCDGDDSYRALHRAVMTGESRDLCTLSDGLKVLQMIDAAERSVAEGSWIHE